MRIRLPNKTALLCLVCLSAAALSGCANLAPAACDAPASGAANCAPAVATSYSRMYETPILTPLQRYEVPALPVKLQTVDLTRDADDIFQRIRTGFAMPDISNDLVLSHQQWYLNRPDYLRRMVERSSPYLYHIVEEIDRRDMPMELALLPMVESAYNPTAYSRAKASGLWQFIPSTGKRFKLDQNWWKDERRDIVASTAAALEYLQSIYEMHGDWHLALASYNWGEGSVARAVTKNKTLELPTDYQSLSMPRETQNYVPKLQALKNIFSSPETLNALGIPRIPNRPYFATVTKQANIDVKLAAQFAGIPVHEFVALNPAHNRPVIVSDSPMVIPAEKYDHFVSNLEAHEENKKPLSSWQSYTLRPGDRLEKIAPRFGMTVANLKAINGIKGRIRLTPGLTLLVPGNGATPSDPTTTIEPPRFPDANPEPDDAKTRAYTVRKGDTLPAIAKRHGATVAELKRLNTLKSDKLTVGARLVLPSAAQGKGKALGARPAAAKQNITKREASFSAKNKNAKAAGRAKKTQRK